MHELDTTSLDVPCYEVENLHCAAKYLLDYSGKHILEQYESNSLAAAKRLLLEKLAQHIEDYGFEQGLHQLFQCVYFDTTDRMPELDPLKGALANKTSDKYVDFFIRPGSPSSKKFR